MRLLFTNRRYALSTLGRILSFIGTELYNTVFVIYAAAVYKSTLAVSVASWVALVPYFFDLFTGFIADKIHIDKRKLLVGFALFQSALFFIVYLFIGHNSILAFGVISFINITSDVVGMLGGVINTIVYPSILSKEDYNIAFNFDTAINKILQLIVPALGVGLLAISNNNYQFVAIINAISFLVYAWIRFYMYKGLELPKPKESTGSFFAELKEVWSSCKGVFASETFDLKYLIFYTLVLVNVTTVMTQLLIVRLVDHPFFGLSFAVSDIFYSTLFLGAGIVSGLIPNDFLSKMSYFQLVVIVGMFPILSIPFLAYNTDITVLIAVILFTLSLYVFVKQSTKFMQLLYENVEPEFLGRVGTVLSSLPNFLLPIISAAFLALYNFNSLGTWILMEILLVSSLLLFIRSAKTIKPRDEKVGTEEVETTSEQFEEATLEAKQNEK